MIAINNIFSLLKHFIQGCGLNHFYSTVIDEFLCSYAVDFINKSLFVREEAIQLFCQFLAHANAEFISFIQIFDNLLHTRGRAQLPGLDLLFGEMQRGCQELCSFHVQHQLLYPPPVLAQLADLVYHRTLLDLVHGDGGCAELRATPAHSRQVQHTLREQQH